VCAGLPARVRDELIDPLCLSALNTPPAAASGRVFLRVLHDALLGTSDFAFAASDLLVPRVDLGAVFPHAACAWLAEFGATVRLGQRVAGLERVPGGWMLEGERWDRVVLACPPGEAARLAMLAGASTWAAQADALQHEAIATVYATGGPRLPLPLLALRGGPAQFVFDRSQLGGPAGLLAFVTSASTGSREEIEAATLAQARALGWQPTPLRTVVERRATFACTPGLQRPPQQVAAGLLACGDYVAGPYPATLEQAVRSGIAAGRDLGQAGEAPAARQPT
jgi:hypothetical protein